MGRLIPISLVAMVVALVGFGAIGSRHVAIAQSVTTDQLSAAALSTFDLGDFDFSQDGDLAPPRGFDSAFLRSFISTKNGGSALIDALLAAGANLPPSALHTPIESGMVFAGFRDGGNASTANFQINGPLGIGDFDQSASWNSYDERRQAWDTRFADAFLQGDVLVMIIYVLPQANPDGSALAGYATLQDQKLISTSTGTQ